MPRKKLSPFTVIKNSDDILTSYKNMSAFEQDKVLTMVATHLGEKGNWSAVNQMLMDKNITIDNVNSLAHGIILINTLLNLQPAQEDDALKVLHKLRISDKTRKRHCTIISTHFYRTQNWSMMHHVFMKYCRFYDLDTSDLDWIFHPDVPKNIVYDILNEFSRIASRVVTHDIKSTMKSYSLPLKKISFTKCEVRQIIDSLNTYSVPNLITHSDDQIIVVDAANVLYYNHQDKDRGIQPRSYYQLDNLVNLLQDTYPGKFIVLVLRKCYLSTWDPTVQYTKNWSTKNKFEVSNLIQSWYNNTHTCIFSAPYSRDDDLYSIHLAVKHNAHLVTNDKFLNHIAKVPLLKVWRDEMIIEYDIPVGTSYPILNPGLPFSHRHQCDSENFYVPTTNPHIWKVVAK